jgi:hypothetical protein
MPHSSLRKLQVAIYQYTESTDESTGITVSRYQFVPSGLPSGLWWASRGIVFGKETAPTANPQDEQTSFWSLELGVPVGSDDVVATGTITDGVFVPVEVFRVQSVIRRDYFRREVQLYCTRVDDAEGQFTLIGPE